MDITPQLQYIHIQENPIQVLGDGLSSFKNFCLLRFQYQEFMECAEITQLPQILKRITNSVIVIQTGQQGQTDQYGKISQDNFIVLPRIAGIQRLENFFLVQVDWTYDYGDRAMPIYLQSNTAILTVLKREIINGKPEYIQLIPQNPMFFELDYNLVKREQSRYGGSQYGSVYGD